MPGAALLQHQQVAAVSLGNVFIDDMAALRLFMGSARAHSVIINDTATASIIVEDELVTRKT